MSTEFLMSRRVHSDLTFWPTARPYRAWRRRWRCPGWGRGGRWRSASFPPWSSPGVSLRREESIQRLRIELRSEGRRTHLRSWGEKKKIVDVTPHLFFLPFFFFSRPNQQRCCSKSSEYGARCTHVYAHLAPTCYAQSALGDKNFGIGAQSEVY